MRVRNIHERFLPAPPSRVGTLLDALATPADPLWPHSRWPALRLDRPLAVGAVGGHGPIRYTVEAYEPGRHVRFRFTGPSGFLGTHAFLVEPTPDGTTRLRHELLMRTAGWARLTWPVVFRPLHDALIEDALDRAALASGVPAAAPAWSPWVHVLRVLLGRGGRARARRSADRPARTGHNRRET
jgi:hypothetical protein